MSDEFDFDNIEVFEKTTSDEFDFDLVFDGDEPEFDVAILDQPVGDYGDDDENDDNPNFGVTASPLGPRGSGPKNRELVGV